MCIMPSQDRVPPHLQLLFFNFAKRMLCTYHIDSKQEVDFNPVGGGGGVVGKGWGFDKF